MEWLKGNLGPPHWAANLRGDLPPCSASDGLNPFCHALPSAPKFLCLAATRYQTRWNDLRCRTSLVLRGKWITSVELLVWA